jgi:LacI family transcriptional regulator
MSAYFLIQKLNSLGVKVPEHVSLISFDNTMLAQTCNPPLTSVDISEQEFATLAYDLIISWIGHPKSDIRQVYPNTKIIERESIKSLI